MGCWSNLARLLVCTQAIGVQLPGGPLFPFLSWHFPHSATIIGPTLEGPVMVDQARALVEKQVGRVQRRLFLQVTIHCVVLCWAIGLLAAMVWFLLRPFTFAEAGDAVRWS